MAPLIQLIIVTSTPSLFRKGKMTSDMAILSASGYSLNVIDVESHQIHEVSKSLIYWDVDDRRSWIAFLRVLFRNRCFQINWAIDSLSFRTCGTVVDSSITGCVEFIRNTINVLFNRVIFFITGNFVITDHVRRKFCVRKLVSQPPSPISFKVQKRHACFLLNHFPFATSQSDLERNNTKVFDRSEYVAELSDFCHRLKALGYRITFFVHPKTDSACVSVLLGSVGEVRRMAWDEEDGNLIGDLFISHISSSLKLMKNFDLKVVQYLPKCLADIPWVAAEAARLRNDISIECLSVDDIVLLATELISKSQNLPEIRIVAGRHGQKFLVTVEKLLIDAV